MTKEPNDSAALLASLQQKTFQYFWTEVNPTNGLVVDSTKEGWPASIAAIGMALCSASTVFSVQRQLEFPFIPVPLLS